MAGLPRLDEVQIERRVGRRGLARGREYFQRGAVHNARRQGRLLKAACQGSGGRVYQVQVELNSRGIVGAGCTCPVGTSGTCKHVGAVLVCYRERPEAFVEVEELGAALARCSRGELISLLVQIVARYPELEGRIQGILPGLGVPRAAPSVESFRAQAAALLRRAEEHPDDTPRIVEHLHALREIGDALARQHEFASAAVVYRAIAAELVSAAAAAPGRSSPWHQVLDDCAAGLAHALANLREDAQARREVLETLLGIYQYDLLALGEARADVPQWVATLADEDERLAVARRLRALLDIPSCPSARRALGRFLLLLEQAHLGDEAFAHVCRQTGLVLELVRRRLGQGRLAEAVTEAAAAEDSDLVRIADLFAAHHHPVEAEQVVRARVESGRASALVTQWLQRFEARTRQRQASLRLAQRLFRLDPQMRTYLRLRQLARQLGCWDPIHAEALATLERLGQWNLLVRVHLRENELERAVELVSTAEALAGDWACALRVARAVEPVRPEDAAALYRRHAERLIARADPEDFADACRYLRRVRSLWMRSGRGEAWTAYIVALRRHYARLPALLRELDAAEL